MKLSPCIREPSGRWNAHSSTMKRYFGLHPSQKWPANGLPRQQIQGFYVWVAPLSNDQADRRARLHRVRAECPHCGRVFSAGRLHQHKCE